MIVSRIWLLKAAACAALAAAPARAQVGCCLTGELLQEAGFHLPSYMPTVLAYRQYATSAVTTYQQLDVEWDSLPGRPDIVRYEDVKGIPLAGNFVVAGRKRRIKGALGMGNTDLMADGLVVVGTAPTSQVRSLWAGGDPRVVHGEGTLAVSPKVTLTLYLPDDPQIQTVVFLRPQYDGRKWTLQRVGEVTLPKD
jgi:hypothetical protein